MNKYLSVLALPALTVLLFGCSQERTIEMMRTLVAAPSATIERDVKGHEMISSIQAVLHYALPVYYDSGDNVYFVYGISSKPTPFPLYQEIDIRKDDSGNLVITSDRKAFDVIKGENVFYGLELKYFDVNGQLINHQFSTFDPLDFDASTIEQHQTFFTLQNYSLDRLPLTYPMTLDSLYIDDFFLSREGGKPVKAGFTSPSVVYLPEDYEPGTLMYDKSRALLASDAVMTQKVTEVYTDPSDGKKYRLYETLEQPELIKKTRELFSYEYRDTDPVDEPLGKTIANDDLPDYDETTHRSKGTFRSRLKYPVSRLRIDRRLEPGQPLDALGFKGIMQFKRKNVCFQMRVSICHILSDSPYHRRPATGEWRSGKYDNRGNQPSVHASDNPGESWNNYDLDFPIPFRVIADADDPRDVFKQDLLRYYTDVPGDIDKILSDDDEVVNRYFRRLYFGQPPFKM
ncbi:MAG: hypothetical protein MR609_01395 [Bacteroidales bacterium]|nr:hypothetical protein [Bacteroidales bacterium]